MNTNVNDVKWDILICFLKSSHIYRLCVTIYRPCVTIYRLCVTIYRPCVTLYRPCVTWRDIQHLIVYTAVKVDASGANWLRNTAGFHHSREHGFGRLDGFRITMAAKVQIWDI